MWSATRLGACWPKSTTMRVRTKHTITATMADTQVESTSSYQYDSLGRRVRKQSEIKGQTEHKHFLWQGLRMLREESPGQSSLYLYEPGSYAPLAHVDRKEGETGNKVY
ncbi:Conserved hypothetical proetein [Pseudomonas coronafaciens pv. porri]|nr:Conserved hypothetical proetein [Pseudomonas coronafaciens pv. porri]